MLNVHVAIEPGRYLLFNTFIDYHSVDREHDGLKNIEKPKKNRSYPGSQQLLQHTNQQFKFQ